MNGFHPFAAWLWCVCKIMGIHKINIRVGICENCKEKIYPKESAMIIERIRKPNFYSLELPNDIVDKLIISANKKGVDFRKYALQKLAE